LENRARQTVQIKGGVNKKINAEKNLTQKSNFSPKNNHIKHEEKVLSEGGPTKLKASLTAREITHHGNLKNSHDGEIKEQNNKAPDQQKEYDKRQIVTKWTSFEKNNAKINETTSTEKKKLIKPTIIRQKTSINSEEKSNDENRHSSKKVSFIENQSEKNKQINAKSSIKESDFEKIAVKTVNDANNLALVTYVSMVFENEIQTEQSRHSELALERVEESFKEGESVSENFDSATIIGKTVERVSLHEQQSSSDSKISVSIHQENEKYQNGLSSISKALNKEIQTDTSEISVFKKESKSNLSRSNLVQSSLTHYLEEDFRKNPKTKKFDSIIITKDDAKNAFPKIKRKLSMRSFSSSLLRPKHDCLSNGEKLKVDFLSKKREIQLDKSKTQTFYKQSENFQIFTRKSQVDYLIDYSDRLLRQEKNPTRVKSREFLSGFNREFINEILN
jgi:hypothetical protein